MGTHIQQPMATTLQYLCRHQFHNDHFSEVTWASLRFISHQLHSLINNLFRPTTRKHQSATQLVRCEGTHWRSVNSTGDRWISPQRAWNAEKRFHLMTSSCLSTWALYCLSPDMVWSFRLLIPPLGAFPGAYKTTSKTNPVLPVSVLPCDLERSFTEPHFKSNWCN